MPYLNLDDNYPEHPKVDALSDAAFRLHTSAMCYAAKHLTDGVIPGRKVARLMPGYKASIATELVKAGLWHRVDDGYQIHDYLQWNKSREWWLQKRKSDAARQAEWRSKRDTH